MKKEKQKKEEKKKEEEEKKKRRRMWREALSEAVAHRQPAWQLLPLPSARQ